MEDRYLFKAKAVETVEELCIHADAWVMGCLYATYENYYIMLQSTDAIPRFVSVDSTTLCQCTGLKDKNGKLIWEDDVIEVAGERYSIEWQDDSAMWVLNQGGSFAASFDNYWSDEVEFIGNIFDNPELLESEG